jgi:hypothetical protein
MLDEAKREDETVTGLQATKVVCRLRPVGFTRAIDGAQRV